MASDQSFLLGEYGARLNALEETVAKIDTNVDFLVQRETERGQRERDQKLMLTTAGGFLGAVIAFIASVVKEWFLK